MKQICKECLIDKELSEYYNHPYGKNGVLGRCKECIISGRKSDKERAMGRKWEKDNRKRPEGYLKDRNKKYKEENKIKYKAQKSVSNYMRYNKDKYDFKCIICGTKNNIHKHHHDYSKPNEIVPVCCLHHSYIHNGKIKLNKNFIIKLPF